MSGVTGSNIDDAASAIDALLGRDLAGLCDDELHEALRSTDRLRRRVEAEVVRLLGEIDVRRSFEPLGAKTAGSFAAWQLPIADDQARAMVRCSRQLRRMPLVEAAHREGSITVDHVRRLATCEATNPEAFAEGESMLVGLALTLNWVEFGRAVAYWCNLADPDGSLRDAEQRFLARKAHVTDASDGMVLVEGQLDPVSGEIFTETFRRIEHELFLADWEAARLIHGDDTCIAHLARTNAQRGADALRAMAERANLVQGDLADVHGPRPLITVLVGEATLANLCETEAGTVLDPREILQLLDRAEAERIVFDGPSRVIDVGVRQRFFTGATRRAVQVRDRRCDHPSCNEPVTDADIDHILEYSKDGLTVQINGRVYCKWHHRWRHRQDRPPKPAA